MDNASFDEALRLGSAGGWTSEDPIATGKREKFPLRVWKHRGPRKMPRFLRRGNCHGRLAASVAPGACRRKRASDG